MFVYIPVCSRPPLHYSHCFNNNKMHLVLVFQYHATIVSSPPHSHPCVDKEDGKTPPEEKTAYHKCWELYHAISGFLTIAIGLGQVSILMSIALLWWQRAAIYNIYVNWKTIELSAYEFIEVVYLHFRACFATFICMLHSAGDSGGLLNQCPPECVGCVGGSGGTWLIVFLVYSYSHVSTSIARYLIYKVIYFHR